MENREVINGQVSDGYHTFDELYDHRNSIFLALLKSHPEISWVSHIHHDGSYYSGWFIAGLNLPTGDVTYHLPEDMFSLACRTGATVMERAPAWDGHTPDEAAQRLRDWIRSQ